MADRFDLFGHRGLSYGDPIDWHRDPLRNRVAPRVHWSRVPYLDVERVGDHKVIWELNRHQHLVTLAQAYWLTGEPAYAATVVRHMTEWMNANPAKVGINWSSSLELAFRAISWTWAIGLLRSSGTLPDTFLERTLKYVNIHGHHIEANLSTYFSPNTHLTGEALGLLYIGTFFPELRRAPAWRELGWEILVRELGKQVRPDGVYFEQTSWYQRYTAEFYLHALHIRARSGHTIAPSLCAEIGRLLEPLVHFSRPDGTIPLIGDDDGGQLLPLSVVEPNDFGPTFALAAVVLDRADCATLAGSDLSSLAWTMGEEGLDAFDRMNCREPQQRHRLFEASGYFTARNRWARDADYLLVDCGPHGALSSAHSHADALSFELALSGNTLVVDPGTFSYVPPERDGFRATAAHNAITIDDESSSVPAESFRWSSIADCALARAFADDRCAVFEGSHDGFRRLRPPVTHARSMFAVFGWGLVVRDKLDGRAEHTATGRFHLAPGLSAAKTPGTPGIRISKDVTGREAAIIADVVFFGPDEVRVDSGLVARTYGSTVNAPVCVYTSRRGGPAELVSVFVSRPDFGRNTGGALAATELATERGRAFELAHGDGVDVVAFGQDGIAGPGFTTDARWLWIRHSETRAPQTFLALDASHLTLAGVRVFAREHRVPRTSARREASGWHVE